MTTSELITPQHLARQAIIYVRQSTPHQTLSHQESLRLQYALRQRALDLGWPAAAITVIDCDLGTTAASAAHRAGFKDLLAQVTLGEVGIMLSFDVTRLSRHCSDWYPLLDVCGYKGCLMADRDGVYDPGSANGRLLLGLKGQLSELELHTLRARLTAGLLNKAERGDLALRLPVGLIRDPLGVVHKDPNREVQSRLELIFATFLRVRSASQVLRVLKAQELTLPRQDRFGQVVWRKPTVPAILSILKHPAYAGAFTYGRTRTVRTGPGPHQARQQPLPLEDWKIRVNDKYPAYISWDTYERIRAMLEDNYAEYDRNKTRGVPRPGKALLHGLVYCGECGHKMMVQYKGGTHYLCNYLRQQYGVPVCPYLPADPIDDAVVQAFFTALSPLELDAYSRVIQVERQTARDVDQAHRQQLERLRYQAALAERQFHQVDPDNRLVAAELERRWETALRELSQAEAAYDKTLQPATPAPELPAELQAAFMAIGQKLPELWPTAVLSTAQKKALLRCLIDKVVIQRHRRDQVHTRIVWKGGDITTMEVPIPVGSMAELSDRAAFEQRRLALSRQGLDDAAVAQQLTAEGFRSPMNPAVVLPSTVQATRLKHGLLLSRHQSHPRHYPGYLTVSQLAKAVAVAPHWLYDRIHKGTIILRRDDATGLYLFPDRPATLLRLQQLRDGQCDRLPFTQAP
ncbi:MAG: recombinase family protein [Candidatus Competibacteraceae bacterium]